MGKLKKFLVSLLFVAFSPFPFYIVNVQIFIITTPDLTTLSLNIRCIWYLLNFKLLCWLSDIE